MKLSLALLSLVSAAPGAIRASVGTVYKTVALKDNCKSNPHHDQVETVTIDSISGRVISATVAYKPLHSGSWTMRDGVHVECWHHGGAWDETPIISKKDKGLGYGYGRGNGPSKSHSFSFEVQTNLDVEQHYIRCGIIDLASKYDRFDRDSHCAHRYAGRSSAHHFDNVDAPFKVVPGIADATNKCVISGTKYGETYLKTVTKYGISQAQCFDLAESTFRANANGSIEAKFTDTASKASEFRAFGRKGVRCMFKFPKCANGNVSPLFRASQNLMANDRSMGWDALPMNAAQCKAQGKAMALECGAGSIVLTRAEAGVMCNEHNHAQDWCQKDKTSPVPKQPFEPGYVAPSAGGDRNPGTNCYGSGCKTYHKGAQICKHFKCKYTKGKTTVFGFINSNEKYHCARNGPTECQCTCHEDDSAHKCTICHDTPDFTKDPSIHHTRTPQVCNEHCPDTVSEPVKNCRITFNKGCPNEFDHSRATSDPKLRERGLIQFTDQFKNHVEHAANAASCHARATELRAQCFYHPENLVGYGSVTASFEDGTAVADQWKNVCGIKFHKGKHPCPAMERKYTQLGLWKAHDPQRTMYNDHTESAVSESACLERATDFRKLCYTSVEDGQGAVTAVYLDTRAQRTDAWEKVCGITARTCPTLEREYGAIPESHSTHITQEAVSIQVRPKHPENMGARKGYKIIDTRQLNIDSSNNGKRHPQSDIDETRDIAQIYAEDNPEVKERVTKLNQATCLDKARSIHEECFTGTEVGVVSAIWMPTKTTEVVTSSKDKIVYFKKTAAQINGQTGCKISMSDKDNSCPRASAQNKQLGWDQIPHYEWSHDNKDTCLARAKQIYDFCYFWPGADDTLNNYINKNDEFVGRPDLFYPGSVTATWEGDKNEYGEFTGAGVASETVCTGEGCAPGAVASNFDTITTPHTSPHTDTIAHAIYNKDANQKFQTAEADRTMGYTTPNSRKVKYGNQDGTEWAN